MAYRKLARVLTGFVAPLACLAVAHPAFAQSARALDVRAAKVIEHWTPERKAAAIPRDLAIDPRGYAYLRGPGNSLIPYGHTVAAEHHGASPNAAPGGDNTPPSVTNMNPAAGTILASDRHNFSATVSDASGVRSVSMSIRQGTGAAQSFAMSQGAGGTWSVSLSGLTNGSWSWSITAKDAARGGGNTTTTAAVPFTVSIGSGGGGGPGTVPNAEWTTGGVVQEAVGRIYFEMPDNRRLTRWAGYVCSGTVAVDGTTNRSIIITAAHCVYDDVNKAFARNVMFIPNQANTSGAGTDRECANDPIGCWVPSIGIVDTNWTTRTFPDNIPWDYAFYVVPDSGAHQAGAGAAVDKLDDAVTAMDVSFSSPSLGVLTHALGYSYSEDPKFMYCADSLSQESAANWWLGNCGLSGGSSGGPWAQPFTNGNGPIVSVNSWGYTGDPGMAGPKLSGTSAGCVFSVAKAAAMGTFPDGQAGVKANCQ
ncbi:MAG TPA: hypothetical protein VEC19_11520 [Usitatibacter sp.]|nr:hypothetical protein [Usitatibacter sp.]